MEHDSQTSSTSEIGPDLKHLKNNTAASIGELREFMSKFQGRKPQEVMGEVAQSDLLRSIGVASVGIAVLILVLTIIPYSMSSAPPKKVAATTAQETQEAADKAPVKPAAAPQSGTETTPDLERAAKAMQLDETKTADPNSNPLDDKFDKLLDDPD